MVVQSRGLHSGISRHEELYCGIPLFWNPDLFTSEYAWENKNIGTCITLHLELFDRREVLGVGRYRSMDRDDVAHHQRVGRLLPCDDPALRTGLTDTAPSAR